MGAFIGSADSAAACAAEISHDAKRGWPGRESRPPIRGLAPSTARDQNINEMELGKLPSRDVTPTVNRPASCIRKNACAQRSKAVPSILDKRWREGLP